MVFNVLIEKWLISEICVWKFAWIFLFQNLFNYPASHDMVQIKLSVCHSTVIDLADYWIIYKSTMPMVQGSPLHLAPYIFVMTPCTFQFMGPLFL